MGTRATIKFTEGEDLYYIYRGHDGYPENVLADIEATIKEADGRWGNPEIGCLVTLFLAMGYDFKKMRLPYYDLTSCFHGDESYRYFVNWNNKERKWDFGTLEF